MTPELEQEGHARELVRHIQQLRKDSNLEINDRIRLLLPQSPQLDSLLSAHRDYIVAETLTLEVARQPAAGNTAAEASATFSLGEEKVTIGLTKFEIGNQ